MTNLISLVISALLSVETGGGVKDGDGGLSVGPLQIQPVTVAEANRLSGRSWTLEDRRSKTESVAMATVILTHHYNRGTTDPVLLGGRWRNPYSTPPTWYLRKVRKALERGQ
jgi:hypothetical protein